MQIKYKFITGGISVFVTALVCAAMFFTVSNAQTSPQVTVLDPNQAKVLLTGETYEITWSDTITSNETYFVNLFAVDGTEANISLTDQGRSEAGAGSYQWTIDDAVAPGEYKIRICRRGAIADGRCDVSDESFTVGQGGVPAVAKACPDPRGDRAEVILHVTDFGANGADHTDDTNAFAEALTCARDLLADDAQHELATIYVAPGTYIVNEVIAIDDITTTAEQSMAIVGAGTGISEIKTSSHNRTGVFDFRFTSETAQLTLSQLSLSPQRQGAGTAVSVSIPDADEHFTERNQVVVKDVVMVDVLAPVTLHHFDNALIVEGAQNPVIDNLRTSSGYGPTTNEQEKWFETDVIVTLRNTYAAQVKSSALWGAKIGLLIENTNPRRDPSTDGVELNHIVSVHNKVGVDFRSVTTEPVVHLFDSHINAANQGLRFAGSWQLDAHDNLFFFMFYGLGDRPFHTFEFSDAMQPSVIRSNVFQTPGDIAGDEVVILEPSGTEDHLFIDNTIYHPSIVFAEAPHDSIVTTGNQFHRDSGLLPQVTVTSLETSTTFAPGSTQTLTWSDTVMDEDTLYFVVISNPDLGNTTLSGGAQNGQYEWTVPHDLASGPYTVRVCRRTVTSDYSSGRCDQSTQLFTVEEVDPQVTVTSPNGGESVTAGETLSITWDDTVMDSDTLYFVTLSNVETGNTTLTGGGKDGEFGWTIPTSITPGQYAMLVCRRGATSDYTGGRCDRSDDLFTVAATAPDNPDDGVDDDVDDTVVVPPVVEPVDPQVTVAAPNGGESATIGETLSITWDDTVMDNDTLYFVTLSSAQFGNSTLTGGGRDGEFEWTIPTSVTPSTYTVLICRRDATSDYTGGRCDQSDGLFNIEAATPPDEPIDPQVTVTSPNGGESATIGETLSITWDDTVMDGDTLYFVTLSSTQFGNSILTGLAKDGQYEWTIPDSVNRGSYSVRICRRGATSDYTGGRCDQSDRLFEIE